MNIIMSDKEKKRQLILCVVDAMRRVSPALLKESAEALKTVRANEFCPKTGKLRAEINGQGDHGYISMRMPRELFFVLRKFWPTFGNDSDDIRLLADEFPDLCQNRKERPKSLRVMRDYGSSKNPTEGSA